MSAFDASWLALREPGDDAARSRDLSAAFAAALPTRATLVDLGSGTGANFRHLAPRLGPVQDWLLVDHDADLLAALPGTIGGWARATGWSVARIPTGLRLDQGGRGARRVEVAWSRRDLAKPDGFPRDPVDGVTGSALLDLASASWLTRLAARCRDSAVLFVLSFDGRLSWRPEDEDDATIGRRILAHQRTDKGFGFALGPDACAHLAAELDTLGHRVRLEASDWCLGAEDGPLLEAMLDGIVAAAGSITHDQLLDHWAERRRRQLAAGTLGLTVGHQDLLALPG